MSVGMAALLDASTRRRELGRFLRFAAVGMLGAIIDYSVLNVLILVMGFSKFWANCCSFSVAVLSNFVWNRLWTFPESRSRPIRSQLPLFAFLNVIGLAINQAVFLSVDRYALGTAGAWSFLIADLGQVLGVAHSVLSYNLSKACATVVALFWNFGSNRLWTYRGL